MTTWNSGWRAADAVGVEDFDQPVEQEVLVVPRGHVGVADPVQQVPEGVGFPDTHRCAAPGC